jgi:hypothetical protein
MPALTLAQVTTTLGAYVEPDGDFTASLNQVLARIYSMGTYRDLTIQYSLPVQDGCITLPDDADAILHVMVDGYPVPVRALWHDFRSIGNNTTGADISWGLIDAGYHPTLRLLGEDTDTLYITPSSYSLSSDSFSDGEEDNEEGEEAVVAIIGTDGEQLYTGVYDSETETYTFDAPISSILSIQFDNLTGIYDLRTTAGDPDTTIATVGSGSGVTRYRRFRINRSVDNTTVVHVLCKRAFTPLVNGTDILYVGNIGAIKHGLLGRIAEDNADLERADYHWNKCMFLLEEEASSSRGAAIPRLNIDPYGTGNQARLSNIL